MRARHPLASVRVPGPRALLALLILCCFAAFAPATAAVQDVPSTLRQAGVERVMFTAWDGPPIALWLLRPPGTPADVPVLFVFHGVNRDADRYIGEWSDLARQHRILVVAPEFDARRFPGARNYNHGRIFDDDGRPRPRTQWTFAAIEPMFDMVRAREQLTTERYSLYGHSAGAQFVHRFVLTGHGPRLAQAIAANAGSYAMPATATSWPFGMGGLPEEAWAPAAALGAPLTILLGTADNDPNHRNLPRDAGAMAQGPHRLARGARFYATGARAAAEGGHLFAWTCLLVPGVGHSNAGMAPVAAGIAAGTIPRGRPAAPCVPAEPAPAAAAPAS